MRFRRQGEPYFWRITDGRIADPCHRHPLYGYTSRRFLGERWTQRKSMVGATDCIGKSTSHS